jgi:hypothetical protein
MKLFAFILSTFGVLFSIVLIANSPARINVASLTAIRGGDVCYVEGDHECEDPPESNCQDIPCVPETVGDPPVVIGYNCPSWAEEPGAFRAGFPSCVIGYSYTERLSAQTDWCFKWRPCLASCVELANHTWVCNRSEGGGVIRLNNGTAPKYNCNTKTYDPTACKIEPE